MKLMHQIIHQLRGYPLISTLLMTAGVYILVGQSSAQEKQNLTLIS